jgi:ribonuclease HII
VKTIVGIDEVGRGSLAGPMAAAAVLIDDNFKIAGVTDSKKLTSKKREALFAEIQKYAICIGIGWVSARELDEVGLTEANRLVMQRSLNEIDQDYDRLCIDGNYAYINDAECIMKGDSKEQSIAAASIIAKVLRDRYMIAMSKIYPGYGFETNVGYGTKKHLGRIKVTGKTVLHRLSFTI